MSTGKETAGDGLSTGINNISIDSPIKSNLNVADGVQVTCFSEVSDDLTLHFQIIRLPNQVFLLFFVYVYVCIYLKLKQLFKVLDYANCFCLF